MCRFQASDKENNAAKHFDTFQNILPKVYPVVIKCHWKGNWMHYKTKQIICSRLKMINRCLRFGKHAMSLTKVNTTFGEAFGIFKVVP